jgi:hypothetical protein
MECIAILDFNMEMNGGQSARVSSSAHLKNHAKIYAEGEKW